MGSVAPVTLLVAELGEGNPEAANPLFPHDRTVPSPCKRWACGATRHRLADVIVIDGRLKRLAQLDPRQSNLIELRFFAGRFNRDSTKPE